MCSALDKFNSLNALNRKMTKGLSLIQVGGLYAVQMDHLASETGAFWHGSFLRLNGVSKPPFDSLNTAFSSGDKRAHVQRNRKLIIEALNVRDRCVAMPELTHSSNVTTLSSGDGGRNLLLPNADAVVSSSDHCLFISTADCNPIFLIDPKRSLMALVHAGWKGLVGKIIGKTIEQMVSAGSQACDIHAAIGPSIGPCCYKLRDPAQTRLPEWKQYLTTVEDGLIAIDLWTPVEDQLISAGVMKKHIQNSRFCTSCNSDLFFSYWKGKPQIGRFASVMFRKQRADLLFGG
jgi:YfiH family protein